MAAGLVGLLLLGGAAALTTCPGFPGFCSEAFPGNTCNVVCSYGRNNVPLCQDDGTWSDIPRCIEHDPGEEDQVPGLCPAIPGYCSSGFKGTECKFDCREGPDIRSLCTDDGTWAPYPTCQGDLRETRDGCDGCPGPDGRSRNRTAEQIERQNVIPDKRLPKIIPDNAGNRNFVPNFETSLQDIEEVKKMPISSTAPSVTASIQTPSTAGTKPAPVQNKENNLTLFERIKNRINKGKATPASKPILKSSTTRRPPAKQTQAPFQYIERNNPSPKFGVFEEINLQINLAKEKNGKPPIPEADQQPMDFFGEFPEVKLQRK